jgi:hypothetical protein
MNWLSVILLVLFVLTLLILVLIAGYSSGKQEGKKEAATNIHNGYGEPGPSGPAGPVGAMGATGPAGKDGETPNANDLIVDPILDLTLAEWKRAVESRLTRVEKKSGLSV